MSKLFLIASDICITADCPNRAKHIEKYYQGKTKFSATRLVANCAVTRYISANISVSISTQRSSSWIQVIL